MPRIKAAAMFLIAAVIFIPLIVVAMLCNDYEDQRQPIENC